MEKQNIREAKYHPDFEPFMVFNDKAGCTGTLYFQSYLEKSPLFFKLLTSDNPYYKNLIAQEKQFPEKYKIIKVKKGGYARLPHSAYTVTTSDNSPCTYSQRALKDM